MLSGINAFKVMATVVLGLASQTLRADAGTEMIIHNPTATARYLWSRPPAQSGTLAIRITHADGRSETLASEPKGVVEIIEVPGQCTVAIDRSHGGVTWRTFWCCQDVLAPGKGNRLWYRVAEDGTRRLHVPDANQTLDHIDEKNIEIKVQGRTDMCVIL